MFLVEAGKKYIKSSEELVSMLLGLAIVVVIISLMFNFVQRRKGTIDIPGETNITLSEQANKEKISEEGVYVVKNGDNLWKIAVEKYNDGYAWTRIAKENNLKNASVLTVGQKLKLPVMEQKLTASVTKTGDTSINKIESDSYKVVRNDNLWKIAVRAYGDGYKWVNIWQENKSIIRNPNQLEIGMTVRIPKL